MLFALSFLFKPDLQCIGKDLSPSSLEGGLTVACLSSSAPTELSGRHQFIINSHLLISKLLPPSNAIPTRPENQRAEGMSFYPS
jgi:hypothetical protein